MKHPPLVSRRQVTVRECLDEEGAQRLAQKIRDAWARCGVNVETQIVQVTPKTVRADPVFGVRLPGLINGLPARS